jgi:exodeoxyribonuclease VII small subunit
MKKSGESTATEKPNFEAMLEKLRGIVKNLESGDISLEDSLSSFEEGMALAKSCQDKLSEAERRVEILVKSDKNGVETKPFSAE